MSFGQNPEFQLEDSLGFDQQAYVKRLHKVANILINLKKEKKLPFASNTLKKGETFIVSISEQQIMITQREIVLINITTCQMYKLNKHTLVINDFIMPQICDSYTNSNNTYIAVAKKFGVTTASKKVTKYDLDRYEKEVAKLEKKINTIQLPNKSSKKI